jgi:hypothetical protein
MTVISESWTFRLFLLGRLLGKSDSDSKCSIQWIQEEKQKGESGSQSFFKRNIKGTQEKKGVGYEGWRKKK